MRQELPDIIALADRMLASGVSGTLATLFSARGSTYRPLGATMVSLPGMHAGGISGGCLEEYVARQGLLATHDRPASVLSFRTDPNAGDDAPVLGCGGAIEILVEQLTANHLTLLKSVADAYDRDEPSLLACTVERSPGSIAVTREWLDHADEGIRLPRQLVPICRAVVREGRSRHATLSPGRSALVQYVPALTRLVIFGAGDDVRPLCDVGRSLGWHVTVADRRARLATAARFPNAASVVAADWNEIVNALRFTPRTAVVLMTHNLEDDARVLSLLARPRPAFVGALGPSHRRQWLLDEAAAQGARLDDAFAAQLRLPIGLDLGDRSAAAIAVAVAAEITAWINDRDARPLYGQTRRAAAGDRPGVCVA